MSRLNHVTLETAQGKTRTLLDQAKRSLGGVPNFLEVFANSQSSLAGFMALNGSLHSGVLDNKIRERIALAVAEENGCEYRVSAHTALAERAGLDAYEIEAARRGASADAKANAAVTFARAVLDNLGDVTTGELQAIRGAGFDDGEIVEIVSLVGLNILTNLLGKVGQIDIDFPKVQLLAKAAV